MRDNFRPNVRLTTNILMVVGIFLIGFNLSKISKVDRDQQIKEDCVRVIADAMTEEELVKKYQLNGNQNPNISNPSSLSYKKFCTYYIK